MAQLDNKVALVTGAAGGIGQALVHRLAQDGAHVVAVDVDTGFVAATVHLFGEPTHSPLFKFYLIGITYLISFLMISTIRYPSLKQLNLSRRKSHLNVLMLALVVAGVFWYSQQFLMTVAGLYVCSGPVTRLYHAEKCELTPFHILTAVL